MKQYEKDEYQANLDAEKATIEAIKKSYEAALAKVDEKIRVLSTRKDVENMPSIIHQKKYQEQIKSQIEDILKNLQDNQYKTVNDYLNNCYKEGFLQTLYSMQKQGIPFVMPIDQKAVQRAVVLDSKISGGLYSSMGVDVADFKRNISNEISRGIASSLSYDEIARNLKNASKVPISNASRIVRTEGHRIQNQAKLDSMSEAKDKGADVIKQWDSTLDGKTRETHRELDGQIRECDEDFEVQGNSASAPGMFGDPAEDCNCRCTCLTRARWALSSGFTKMDNFSKQLETFETPDSYKEFKKDYWSDENIKYMNYVTDMEDKYGTKDFEKVLDEMSDREYKHYKELLDANPMFEISYEGIPKTWQDLPEGADIMKLNPSGSNENCVNCSIAYEMRMRKKAVVAEEAIKSLQSKPFSGWENPEIISANASDPVGSISKSMLEWGEGARTQISFKWKQKSQGVYSMGGTPKGHSIVARQEGNTTIFIDTQIGKEYTESEFREILEMANKETIQYCRIDNLEINDRGATAYRKE